MRFVDLVDEYVRMTAETVLWEAQITWPDAVPAVALKPCTCQHVLFTSAVCFQRTLSSSHMILGKPSRRLKCQIIQQYFV